MKDVIHGGHLWQWYGTFYIGVEYVRSQQKEICAACTGLRCGRIYILGLALKELIGGRTAVLGPTYK